MLTPTLKRETYDAFLPASPCSSAMREQINEVAAANQTSAASVIRVAVAFYLETNSQKLRENTAKNESSEPQVLATPA